MSYSSKFNSDFLNFIISLNKLPIDQTTQSLNIFRSGISIIDIVGMLPNVNGQNRLVSFSHRVLGIGSVYDKEFFAFFG